MSRPKEMERRPRILIVDDEPFNVDYLEQELEDLDYVASHLKNLDRFSSYLPYNKSYFEIFNLFRKY